MTSPSAYAKDVGLRQPCKQPMAQQFRQWGHEAGTQDITNPAGVLTLTLFTLSASEC
jgi:hypothetical protein